MTISGWGYTVDKGGILSPDLRFAYVTGWNNTACAATGYGRLITDNMICASTPKIDTDACQGDSGGSKRFIFTILKVLKQLKNIWTLERLAVTSLAESRS
jgi:hypothetical protein